MGLRKVCCILRTVLFADVQRSFLRAVFHYSSQMRVAIVCYFGYLGHVLGK